MKNKHQRALGLLFALLLAIGLTTTGLAFTSVMQPLSGNVSIEPAVPEYLTFTEQVTVTDGIGDVGVPDECKPPNGSANDGFTGWDIDETAFTYDRENDILYVGVSMANGVIAGDPEHNGNASSTDLCLDQLGGQDIANLGSTEGIDVIFDTNGDGTYDYIAGMAQGDDITALQVATYNGDATPTTNIGLGYDQAVAGVSTANPNNPNATAPDFEYQITGFSNLFTGGNGDTLSFCFIARAGSGADAGFGEDILPEAGCEEVTFEAQYDYGDLPDLYNTTLANTGARHILDGATYLGAGVDAETDGIPDTYALSDDNNNNTNDEDGVTFTTALSPTGLATVEVVASTNGYLSAWIDWDGDGTFTPADNRILSNTLMVPGVNVVNFTVPATVVTETLYARFRFTNNEQTTPSPSGVLLNGEVEDYALMSLGDIVWHDNGTNPITPTNILKNDGIFTTQVISGAIVQSTGEAGINDVTVELYRGATWMGRTTTAAIGGTAGRYFFYGLQPGSYSVRVRSSNFVTNQRLDDYISSLGNGSANADIDNDDNGVDNADPATNGIRSGSITLELRTNSTYTISNPTLDFGFVVFTPTIALTKTVYLGDDNGVGCVTGKGSDLVQATNGTTVTYCFEVTNTSTDVWLNNITIDDEPLNINQNHMTKPMTNTITNSVLLTPTGTNYYYYVTTITEDLENTATAEGQPATSSGQALIGLPDVTDTDSARVDEVTPSLELQKTVYFGDDNGNSCSSGEELVTNINAADITYCLEITNTGDTYLDHFVLSDTLGITLTDLTPSTGGTIEPGDNIVFYYESEIDGDFTNSATITATATDDSGTALTQAIVVSDTNTAQVAQITPAVQIQKTVFQGHNNGDYCNTANDGELVTDVNGANVTYCFTVTNNSAGNYLAISISDTDLAITDAHMEPLSGNLPLVPGGAQAVYYYETTINGDRTNSATVTGNPVDSSNNDYADVADVTASDTAQVDEVAPAIDIQKTVYVGDNSGASCPGSDLVTDILSETFTYCFEVTNTGDTYLNSITIADSDLITESISMTLAPNMSFVYSTTTTLLNDLVNTATVTGNPSHANGDDLTGIDNVTDSDMAEVNLVAPAVTIAKTVYYNIDGGTSCSTSGEEVVGLIGNAITFCFVVENKGDTYLDDIDLDDNDLGLDEADMILLSGDDNQPLALGESLVYYYETTITGDITNTASVKANPTLADGTDLVGVPQQTYTDTAKVNQVSPNVSLDKTVSLGSYPGNGASCAGSESIVASDGGDVTYCFKVTNTGDTYLNIGLTDNPLGISRLNMSRITGTLPLAPGSSIEYYYEAEVSGDLVNLATVIGNPVNANLIDLPNIPDVSNQNTAEVDEVSPGITLEKTVYLGQDGGLSCQGNEVVTGRASAAITYCFEVTNTSETYLEVSIDDPPLGITDSVGLLPDYGTTPLAPGASRTYFFQAMISRDWINIAKATGNPVDADGDDNGLADVDDSNSAKVVLATPAVMLKKTVYAGVDNGASCGGFNLIVAENNDSITYCFQVINSGNTYLNNITIDDDDLSINQSNMFTLTDNVLLAPGESLSYYHQAFVDGGLVNTAEVTANPSDENGNDLVRILNVTITDTATVIEGAPAIDIEKTVAAGANAACPDPDSGEIVIGAAGDPITYCFVITNTGDTYLNNIIATDNDLNVTIYDLTGTLAPGESITNISPLSATINPDLPLNTASVTANPIDSTGNDLEGLDNVSNSDSASAGSAGLTLAKTVGVGHTNTGIDCSDSSDLATGTAGTAIFFCFEVTNSGSTFLSNLMITDTFIGDNGIDISDMITDSGSLPLAPGETIAYYYKSLISDDIVNSATASANPVDENGDDLTDVEDVVFTDTATVDLVSSPNIALQKTVYAGHDEGATCSGGEFVNGLPGTNITYCFEVQNMGDTYLNITIDDANLGITNTDMTQITTTTITTTTPLTPGASLLYYYQTTLDINLVNTAVVTGTPTDQNGDDIEGLSEVTDSDMASVEVASSPDVEIHKTVYLGQNAGASCSTSLEFVEGGQNAPMTYCFEIENTGDTYLGDISITDDPLSITQADMTPVISGSVPIAPGASAVYYYNDNIEADLVNTATVSANPTNETGGDLTTLPNVTDSDTAQISLNIATAIDLTDFTANQEASVSSAEYWQRDGFSLAALLILLAAAAVLVYKTILNKQTE